MAYEQSGQTTRALIGKGQYYDEKNQGSKGPPNIGVHEQSLMTVSFIKFRSWMTSASVYRLRGHTDDHARSRGVRGL